MSAESLENFIAYPLAMKVFNLVPEELADLAKIPALERRASRQLANADSIAANIEEGHGRKTTKGFIRFPVIARGSARETQGRYMRMRRWFDSALDEERTNRCAPIIAILTQTMTSLGKNGGKR